MKPCHRIIRGLTQAATLIAALAAAVVACAADDDDLVEELTAQQQLEQQAQQMGGFMMADENFDQWVYGDNRNASTGRNRLNSFLKVKIDDLSRIVTLTDVQKRKLELAGRGDVYRFNERVETIRVKFNAVKNDQNKINNIWQDIQPLRTSLNSGLFGDGSLFARAIKSTLTPEQAEQYLRGDRDRRKFRYQARVELAVAMLDSGLALRDEQRKKLVQLLVEKTPPPRKFGQQDHQYVFSQMSRLPEDSLKPLFDDDQWKAIVGLRARYKGMQRNLERNGIVPDEDDAQPDAKPQPARPAVRVLEEVRPAKK